MQEAKHELYDPDVECVKIMLEREERRGVPVSYQSHFVWLFIRHPELEQPIKNALIKMRREGTIVYNGSFDVLNPAFTIKLTHN